MFPHLETQNTENMHKQIARQVHFTLKNGLILLRLSAE